MSELYSLPTQLLLKHIEAIQDSPILCFNVDSIEIFKAIQQNHPSAQIHGHFSNFGLYKTISKEFTNSANFSFNFDSWLSLPYTCKTVIVYLPPTRALIRMTLSMISQYTETGSQIFLVGQKNEGIKSADSDLEHYIGPIEFKDSGRHSTIYRAIKTVPTTEDTLHNWQETFEVPIGNELLTGVTFPGVFSHGKLDPGTEMLLQTIGKHPGERILDWGCGCGIIGVYSKRLSPQSTVHMADTNSYALVAAKETCILNKTQDITIFPTDVFSEVTEKYSLIISNPPFHSGVKTNYDAVEAFIAQARSHLEKGGELRIVANTFLRYKPLLETTFGNCTILNKDRSYTIYSSIK